MLNDFSRFSLMKLFSTPFPAFAGIAFFVLTAFVPAAKAVPINGESGFDGTIKITQAAGITKLDFGANGAAGGSASVNYGTFDYSTTPGATATFTDFSFAGTGASATIVGGNVTPLWTFISGGLTYSFNLTGLDFASFTTIGSLRSLSLSGTGTASISGGTLNPTFGTFVLTGTGKNVVFHFFAENAADGVPDGGSTLLFLGAAFLGVEVLRRGISLLPRNF